MKSRKLLIIPCLAMATTLFCGVGQVSAGSDPDMGKSAVTGPFRSEQNIMPMRRTTNAQRQEAARLAAEYRANAAQAAANKNKATPGTPPSNATVPPKVKGGTNE